MNRTSHFYLSGFISLCIYVLICILFLFYINTPKIKKYDSLSKTIVVDLEIITSKSNEKKVASKLENKTQKIIKKSASKSNKKVADIKSLFGNVKIVSKKVVEKVVNNIKASSNPSRYKSKFEKQKKSDNIRVSKLLNDVKTINNVPLSNSSTKGETHPYFSKVKEILWQRWNPQFLESGLIVSAIVTITNSGAFDYRIIKYSKNQRFDDALKEFLQSQKSEQFPKHNINKEVDIIINFKSEG